MLIVKGSVGGAFKKPELWTGLDRGLDWIVDWTLNSKLFFLSTERK